MLRCRVSSIALLALLAVTPTANAADDATLRRQVTALFESGRQERGRLKQTEQLYQQIIAEAPGDVRPMYAMTVVAIEARQYRRAREVVDQLLKTQPNVLVARRANIWLLMVLKEYATALDQMQVLARDLAARAPAADDAEMVAFLGRMLGYLDASDNVEVTQPVIDRQARRISEILGGSHAEALAKSRAGQVRDVAQRQSDVEQSQADAMQAERQRRVAQADALNVEQTQTNDSLEILKDQPAQLQADLAALLSRIDGQLAPLDGQFAQLQLQANDVAISIRVLQSQIVALQADLEFVEDEFQRIRLINLLRAHEAQLFRQQSIYRGLDQEATRVNRQRQVLLDQRGQAQNEYQARLRAIQREEASLQKRLQRIARDRADLAAPITGNTGKVRSEAARSEAFTTYSPFPVARETRRVLETLGP